MKIVHISDTHNQHKKIESRMPEGDILVHTGDFSSLGLRHELESFNAFLKRMEKEYKHVVYIAGNHELTHERDVELVQSIMSHGIYLQDSSIVLEGLKFYGSPWQPRFFDWAFNADPGEDILQHWNKIPEDTDVLLTHGPPFGFCDGLRKPFDAIEHLGCRDLLNTLERVKPKLHCFGHIHDAYGIVKFNGTTFSNGSICTERYWPDNEINVIEVT